MVYHYTYRFFVPTDTAQTQYEEYKIWTDSGESTFTQIIKAGEKLVTPQLPSIKNAPNSTFTGWFEEQAYSGNTATPTALKDTPFDFDNDIPQTYTESREIHLFAVFSHYAYVIFHEQYHSGTWPVTETRRGVLQNGQTTIAIDDVTVAYDDSSAGQSTDESTAPAMAFRGWAQLTAEQLSGLTAVPEDTPRVTSPITISGNVDLYPVFVHIDWLTFVSGPSGSGATYFAPKFFYNDEALESLADYIPERKGYTFAGWYADEACTVRLSDDSGALTPSTDLSGVDGLAWNDGKLKLSKNVSIYAKWTSADATYTVVIWRQKIDDDKNAADAEKTYDFAESYVLSATAGTTVTSDAYTSFAGTDDYTHFHLNTNKTDVSAVVDGGGTTVLNVYYDRDLITFEFRYRTFEYVANPNTTEQYYTSNGVPLVRGLYYNGYNYYPMSTYNMYITSRTVFYTRSGNYNNYTYTVANNYSYDQYYYVKRHNSRDNTFTWEKVTVSSYTSSTYALRDRIETYTGLYGQAMSKYNYIWPGNYAWNSPTNDSIYWNYVVTPVSEFNENFVAVAEESGDTVRIDFYFQNTDGSQPSLDRESSSYSLYPIDLYSSTHGFDNLFSGFTPVRYKVGNAAWQTIGNNIQLKLSDDTKVYYERDQYQLSFLDSYDNTALGTNTIRFGDYLSAYKPANDPVTSRPGYEFSGWYADRECTTRVYFDADEYNSLSDRAKSEAVLLTTMPAANMSVYAGWQGKYYLIQLDPNGGEYPADGSYSTWFWKQYGTAEQVNEYRLTTRDFVESLDGDWYYAVRDRAFYGLTDAWDAREDGITNRRAYYTQDISDPAIVDLNTRYTQLEDAYRYANWYEVRYDDNGNETGEELYNFATRIDHDMTLRLHWKQVGTYYIRYDAGDGTLDGNDNNEEVFRILDDADYADHSDMVVTRTANPPEGYNFVGWRVSGGDGTVYFPGESFEFQSKYARAEVVNGETRRYLILEAVYSQVGTAKIIYDANGGSLVENADPGAPTDEHAPAVRVVADTEADTLTVSNLVNNSGIRLSYGTGFAFENAVLAGWNTERDGSGDHFDLDGEYYVDTEEPVTLYAEWKVKVWYHLNHTDTNWGGTWDSSVYTHDDAHDLYYQTVLVNNAVAAPSVVPQYTGAENLTFHYWMDERYSDQFIPYNFSDPVTRELHLFAYWDAPIQLTIHAVDASAEALALRDDSWRVKEAIELHSNDARVAVADIAANTAYLSVPDTHTFAFAAIKSATSELSALSEADAVTQVYFNVQERRVYVKYAKDGKPAAPLPDADELYFVYFEDPKALNIGYKSMDTNGALADVTVANAAPKTASAGVYDMTGNVTSPKAWATNASEYPFYAFAIGDKNAAAEGNLHFVTSPASTDASRPSLRVRNTWRGFQYSTDGGATWTACGYDIQLYVVYFKSQPTIITLQELTRGTEADMREAFEYTVVVKQVTKTTTRRDLYNRSGNRYSLRQTGDNTETTSENALQSVTYNLSSGERESISLLYVPPVETETGILTEYSGLTFIYYNDITITESWQTVTITQTPKTGFETDNASEGGTKTSNLVWTYTTSADSTDQTVTFTNTHTPLTVEAHVALAVNGGIVNRDTPLRTATADDYTLSLPLGGTVTVNAAALPRLFTGDSAVYTLAGIVYGTQDESGAVTAAGSLGSLSYGQIQDNHYELLIDGQTERPLDGYGLYYVYCEMPKLYYAEEAPDGTLTKLNSLTRNGSAFQLNGVTVAQGTTLQVTDAPFVFSQSAAGGYRLPPDLDGAEHLSLDYYRIGVGGASADSVGALEASSTDKVLQLKLMNSQVYYSLDGETWAAFRDAPTVYAIYRKKGFDLTVSKTVANGDTATKAASFTVTVTSDNIEDGAAYTVHKGETVSTVTAEGHALTLRLKDGESAILHAMKRGNYTIAEPDLDAARFAMSARDKDGRSISVTGGNSVSIVLDNDKTAAITNTRRVSTVTVRKVVDPAPAENEAENFTFTATLLDGEDPVAGFNAWQGNDGVTDEQGKVTFALGHKGTKALTVPVGAKLTLQEANSEKYDVYVNDAEDRSHTIESVSADAAAVTFTNKLKTFTITLKKVLVDSSAASRAFDFTYSIDDGEEKTLSISPDADETVTVNYGAKLTVTEVANPNYATAAVAEKAENAATEANTFTIAAVTQDDTITFTNTRYVCKVVTANSRYLMHDKNTGADAVFTTLEAAFAAINQDKVGYGDETSAYRVEMLVPEYTLTEAVTKNGNLTTVTLTTALASDESYPYAGSSTPAVVRRGFDGGSMFTTNGAFILESITLDGNGANITTNGSTVQVASGSLTVNDGATLQNAKSTGSGSAVYVADGATMTMTGGSIANNVGDLGAVSIGSENAKLHFSGSAKVTGNRNTSLDACNVCLDRNTAAIINTTGLTAEAAIGVYVTGADGAEPYDSRGGNMDAFGLYNGNNSDSTQNNANVTDCLSRFVNDRDPSLYGVAHDTGIGEYPTLTGEIVWMKVVPLTITKTLEDGYVTGPQTFTFDVKFSEDDRPYYDYKDDQRIRIDASSTRTVNVTGSASADADVVYVPAGVEITLTETGELDNITTGFTAGEKVNGLSAADRTASFTIDTEATEAAVTVTNRRPPICRIGTEEFYSIHDAVAYASAEDYPLNYAIIEMLVDYIKPASDEVVIPEGLEITLTSAVEAESPYTITRKTGATMFTNKGSLTFTNITVDGNSVEADSAMIASDGAVTVDKGAVLKNATAGAIHATAGTVAVKDGSITGNRSTNGAAIMAEDADVTVSGGSIAQNTATGNGGAICVNGGSVTVSGGAITENSATNGAAVYVESGTASFSGGSITQNTATNGGAVGVKDATARLSFSGDIVIRDNTLGTGDDAVASNVCLDQDTCEIINAEGLGEDAYIGVYVPGAMTADLFKNRGAASAKFGTYTSADNVSAFHNDRSANLKVRADSATQTLIWSMPIKVEMRYVSSFRDGFPPQQVGKNIYGPETYYPESSENVVSTIANELYASVKDKLSVTDIMAYGCALHVKATEFEQFLTHVNWYGDVDGGKWGYVRRDGEVIYEDDTLVLYYTTPVFVTIENNTAYTLTVSELTVLGRNAFKQVGSDDTVTTTGYGYVITKDGRTMEDILPIDAEDLTLAPEGSIMLLFPGAIGEACTLKGSFPNEASSALTEIKCTITGTEVVHNNLTYSELPGFTRQGTIPDAAGASLTYLFGEAKPICKITDDHLFPTLTEAMDYIKTQSDKSAEYRVEMLVDYQIPATDVARIPRGYNVTLSTAVSGNYKYSDDPNARATISRATGNRNSFITALDADINTSLTVQNLNFDGKDAILGGNGGVALTKNCQVTIRNVDFTSFNAGNGGAVYIEFGSLGNDSAAWNAIETPWLTVENATFTKCNSKSTTGRQGGGAIWTNGKSFRVTGSTFNQCTAYDQGGAVFHRIDSYSYQLTSKAELVDCTFNDCEARAGGGLELDALDVTLTNCDFTRCTASQRNGGGCNIYIYDSGNSTLHSVVRATSCTFTGCKTVNIDSNTNYGGGLRSAALDTYVTNCTFENNTSGGSGGGGLAITNANATVAEVNDCQFIGNVANSGNGGGVYYGGANTTLLLDNCTVKGNTTSGSGGGVYTSGNLALRNHTVISNNRLSTNKATNAAGAYIPNGKTLFVGGAGSTSRDTSSVFNNTTSNGTSSNLRLSETGSENSQTSVSVLSNLGGEINVVNAKVRGTQFGSVAQSGYSVVSGGEPVFKGDDGVLYGVKVENNKVVWNADAICKITDGGGNLLYKDADCTIPAVYYKLDHGSGNTSSNWNNDYAFDVLKNATPQLYTKVGGTKLYDGNEYYVKMLVDSFTLPGSISTELGSSKTIIFTTAGTQDTDGYPAESDCATILRGSFQESMIVARGSLKLEKITLDGGSKAGRTSTANGALIAIAAKNITVTVGNEATLQNSVTTSTIGGAGVCFYKNSNDSLFVLDGGTIKQCVASNTAANGGAINVQGYSYASAEIRSGTISNCMAGGKGGGLYLESGSNTKMMGGTITGCKASLGGGVYDHNKPFNISGGVITNNRATATDGGGGIAVGTDKAQLYFSGSVFVNHNYLVENGKNIECNVTLNQSSNTNTIINSKGLTSEADIGIYVTGDKAASLYQKHGINGMPFGTWTSNNCLYRFVNDRDRELRGTFKSTDKLIYWERILCLEVGKTVESEAEKDKDLEFEFTVKLNDWNEGEKKYGDMTFNADGEATFTLKHGQYMALLDDTSHTLETKEYAYTVTEKVAEGFETSVEKDDKGASKANSITGRIGENAPTSLVSKVMFTNTRKTGDLYVSKAVDSESDAEKEKHFVFEVDLGDESIGAPTEENPEGGKTYGDMTFVEGVATFKLKHGESKKAEGLPYGLNVTITETGIWDEALEREMPLENYSTSVERIVGTPPEPAGDDPEETDGEATPAYLRDDTYDTAKREYRVTNFSEEALTIAFTNSNGGFDVALIKIDGEGKPLDGATFALYPDDGATEPDISGEPVATAESTTLTTPVTVQVSQSQEEDGEKAVPKTVSGRGIVVFEKLAPGSYLLTETEFPVYDEATGSRYLPENAEKPLYRLEVNNDGAYTLATQDGDAVPAMSVGEEDDAAQLPSILDLAPVDRKVILRKVKDGTIYESLKGKSFTLKYVNGAVIADELTSSDNGAIWIGRLPLGTYYLDEVDPAVRFTVSVTADGVTVTKPTD